jgi:hypothetical protein
VGANPISIAVTAQDGTTIKTYTVTVTRMPSADAALSGLTVSVGTLSPIFAAATLAYSDLVPMAGTSVDVTATTVSAYATLTINGAAASSGILKAVAVPVGQSTITVAVTAQDGTTTNSYTIAMTRPAITLTPAVSNIVVMSTATLMVTLAAAPGTDTAVALSSSNTAAVTVPASVTVLTGATQATFDATSIALGAASATITATLGAEAPTATVNVSGQCVAASDCPGSDTACQTRTCISNTCGFSYASAGTVIAAQSAGDCHQNLCDGAGNISNAIDNTDVPVDGNVCTSDVCTAGVPSNPNAYDGTACVLSNSAAACTAGACTVSSCSIGFGNCNNLSADGCETGTTSNVNNCGACGNACSLANATAACASGACAVGSCNRGMAIATATRRMVARSAPRQTRITAGRVGMYARLAITAPSGLALQPPALTELKMEPRRTLTAVEEPARHAHHTKLVL